MQLMTVDEIATLLQLQPETIREMARNERIPAIKLGRVWRFDQAEILRWIELQAVSKATEAQPKG